MTNPRTNYLYHFKGQILKKRLAQASPLSKYAGQSYYVLMVQLSDRTKKSVQVFKNKLASPKIWTTIEAGECFNTSYSLFCKNQKGYYYLVDWEPKPPSLVKSLKPKSHHDLN